MKTWKRIAITGAALAAFATPAFADTIKEVTTKGVIITIDQVGAVDITYNPDGTFVGKNDQLEAAIGGPLTGKWRIDGDKLCTTADIMPTTADLSGARSRVMMSQINSGSRAS